MSYNRICSLSVDYDPRLNDGPYTASLGDTRIRGGHASDVVDSLRDLLFLGGCSLGIIRVESIGTKHYTQEHIDGIRELIDSHNKSIHVSDVRSIVKKNTIRGQRGLVVPLKGDFPEDPAWG